AGAGVRLARHPSDAALRPGLPSAQPVAGARQPVVAEVGRLPEGQAHPSLPAAAPVRSGQRHRRPRLAVLTAERYWNSCRTPAGDEAVAAQLAETVRKLRVCGDDAGQMNLSLDQVGGGCLVVSQFTLYGDLRSGNRPGFSRAAPPEQAERLYLEFAAALRRSG